MTYCKNKPVFCECQPDEGAPCPYAPPVAQPAEPPFVECIACSSPTQCEFNQVCDIRLHAPAEPPATDADAVVRDLMHEWSLFRVADRPVIRLAQVLKRAADLIERQAREIVDRDAKLWETRIRAERAEAETAAYKDPTKLSPWQAEVMAERDALRLQNDTQSSLMDALREDAMRYRLLRIRPGLAIELFTDTRIENATGMDAAIDAARAKGKP